MQITVKFVRVTFPNFKESQTNISRNKMREKNFIFRSINLQSFTRIAGFPGNFNEQRKSRERRKAKISAVRQRDASRSIASVENRRCDRQRRGSAGAIEEVVTNKVAGERIRVAESKNDGPPLVVAAVREARQWPRSFPLICEVWPPALPFS